MKRIRFNNRYDLTFAGHSSASESVLADMLEVEAARKIRKIRKPRKPREAITVCKSHLDAVRLASQGEIK